MAAAIKLKKHIKENEVKPTKVIHSREVGYRYK